MFLSTLPTPVQTPYGSMQVILLSEPTSIPISPVSSFDWATLDSIDVNSISFSKRNKPFLRFLRTFRDASAFNGGTPDQLSHLLHILQQSILYFCKDHEKMRQRMNLKEAQVNSLAQQLEKLKHQGQVSSGTDIYYCPICMNGFDSYHVVDMHIEVQHPTLSDKWKEIRHPSISIEKRQHEYSSSIAASEVRPGTKRVTQSDALEVAGSHIHKLLGKNSMTFKDLRNEMNERFQEFADVIKANESCSSYTSYSEPQQKHKEHTKSSRSNSKSSFSTSSSVKKPKNRKSVKNENNNNMFDMKPTPISDYST